VARKKTYEVWINVKVCDDDGEQFSGDLRFFVRAPSLSKAKRRARVLTRSSMRFQEPEAERIANSLREIGRG
jgi:hypothetical protein